MTRLIENTLVGLVAVFVLSTAITGKDTTGKAVPEIGFIQVGHISRIDAKNHIVMLFVQKDDKNDGASVPSRAGGFGRGRLGRFGGLTPQEIAKKMERTFETKVVLTSETILKDQEDTLPFDELKVGDFVEVEGVMHGNDFQAKQLRRHSKKADSPKLQ
jgi:hypothetical protein